MPLYLVRHAHAVSEEENRQRPLSERGREQVRTLAGFFRANHRFTPAFVWHSPLLRARETAELFLSSLGSDAALVETPGLCPDDSPAETAARIAAISSAVNIAIVGHQPHLGDLVSVLLGQKPGTAPVDIRKASVLALERTPEKVKKGERCTWVIEWHVSAELLTPRALPGGELPWPK